MSSGFAARIGIPLMERGLLPESVIRNGIRRLVSRQSARCSHEAESAGGERAAVERFARELRRRPVAPVPDLANVQHYELPAGFFMEVLGSHLKYSCCFWGDAAPDLDGAEQRMLDITIERAGIADGMEVLELGCGWGSLTIELGVRFPGCRITAVSNSALQKQTIERRAGENGIKNVTVLTADMNDFSTEMKFDRVVSIEMFEHMHNYERLMSRIAGWLKQDGKLFLHIFCHRAVPYFFETGGADDWMGRYFFTGGIMPSADLLLEFQEDLSLERQWLVSGTEYERTANAWAHRMDDNRGAIMSVLREHYGPGQARLWYRRWKVFFWACAETFGYDGGREWLVSHYRFSKDAQ